MLREFSVKQRQIHLNAVGIGDVISISNGVLNNWKLFDIGLDGIYELNFEIHMRVKHHNLFNNKSWYKVCRNSNEQPILKRIQGEE